jgi:hypothetical protein
MPDFLFGSFPEGEIFNPPPFVQSQPDVVEAQPEVVEIPEVIETPVELNNEVEQIQIDDIGDLYSDLG